MVLLCGNLFFVIDGMQEIVLHRPSFRVQGLGGTCLPHYTWQQAWPSAKRQAGKGDRGMEKRKKSTWKLLRRML
jgi:hypothetical protein